MVYQLGSLHKQNKILAKATSSNFGDFLECVLNGQFFNERSVICSFEPLCLVCNKYLSCLFSVPEEYRAVNPGSVEAIQENPQSKEQVRFSSVRTSSLLSLFQYFIYCLMKICFSN